MEQLIILCTKSLAIIAPLFSIFLFVKILNEVLELYASISLRKASKNLTKSMDDIIEKYKSYPEENIGKHSKEG